MQFRYYPHTLQVTILQFRYFPHTLQVRSLSLLRVLVIWLSGHDSKFPRQDANMGLSDSTASMLKYYDLQSSIKQRSRTHSPCHLWKWYPCVIDLYISRVKHNHWSIRGACEGVVKWIRQLHKQLKIKFCFPSWLRSIWVCIKVDENELHCSFSCIPTIGQEVCAYNLYTSGSVTVIIEIWASLIQMSFSPFTPYM